MIRLRTLRRLAAAALAVTALVLPQTGGDGSARAAAALRIGMLVDAASPEAVEAAATFRDAPWAEGTVLVERRAGTNDAESRRALDALAQDDGADVMAVFSDAADSLSERLVRGRPVVGIAPTRAIETGVRVRGGFTPSEVRAMLARITGEESRMGWAVWRGGVSAPDPAPPGFVPVEFSYTPEHALTANVAASALDVIWVPPDLPVAVASLGPLLATGKILLVGSRAAHLDAGAAVVLRTAPRDVGALAAVACAAAAEGRIDRAAPARAPHRVVREIHLGHAPHGGAELPLHFLAAADRIIVPTTPVRK